MGVTGAIEDSQLLAVTTTTAEKNKTVDTSSVRLPVVHPNDVHRVLRMNDLVRAVKKAWYPKSHHRHVSLQNQKPLLLKDVPSPTSCKRTLDTITCCSLSGMKKLFSALRPCHLEGDTGATSTTVGDTEVTGAIEDSQILAVTTTTAEKNKTVDTSSVRLPVVHPNDVHRVLRMNDLVHAVKKARAPKNHHRHVGYDKPESCERDSAGDLHMVKALEQATEKPWYRQSYSSFPKPKAHDIVVKKPCMTYHMAWHLRSVPEVSPLL